MSRPTRSATTPTIVPFIPIARRLLLLRGERVILDADLAELYGVTTKALNQAVKRNRGRFPVDFAFRLTTAEKNEVVTNCDHLQSLRYSPSPPTAFTEHGAIMAASVLRSARAVSTSVQLVRTFIRLRQVLVSHVELAGKLDALEQRYDAQFRVVFDAIRALMEPVEVEDPPVIGFQREGEA
jgi:hypothetical protein